MKNVIKLLFLFLPLCFPSQTANKDSLYESLKKEALELSEIYDQYHKLYFQPNKYFSYATLNKNVGLWSYYEKKKYDSLILRKLPDSVVLEKSSLKLEFNNHFYRLIGEVRDFEQYTFLVYNKNDNLISKVELDKKWKVYRKSNLNNLNIFYYYYGDEKYMYQYRYEQYEKKEGYSFANLLYQETVLQDGSTIIYDYLKDFPFSDEEVLKKIPTLFAEHATELLKDGTKIKDFNKNMAKTVSLHMLGAINKVGDEYKYNYKYELKKGYSLGDQSKPVYSFMFFTPNNNFWGLTIDTQGKKLINVDYGKITY